MARQGGAREGAGRKPGKVSALKREMSEMSREHAAEALQSLVDISVNGESESARVAASTAILDRAYGRPTQALQHTGADEKPLEPFSDLEVARRIAFILASAMENVEANKESDSGGEHERIHQLRGPS